MAEYNDNDFGRLIHNIRKSKKIKVDALVKGLCSIKVLYGIEAGDMLPGYLLRSALIGRLELAPEWFENMLSLEEYEEWQLRSELINALTRCEYNKAGIFLEEYRNRYIRHEPTDAAYKEHDSENMVETLDRLRMQYYLAVKGMRTGTHGSDYRLAAAMTSDIFGDDGIDMMKLSEYKLSINELNLYVEAVWREGDKKKAADTIITVIEYIGKNYYDAKAKIKLFSKLVVYYCRLNENTEDAITLGIMWKYCNAAVEALRDDKKSYYIIELFDIQMKLADSLVAASGDTQTEFQKNLLSEKEKIATWRDVLANEYEKRSVPVTMQNDSYIYREGMAYCINDVISARRMLLGINRKGLCDGICAEKTIKKTEQHRSSLQYTNMKRIYERLRLPCTYQNSSIIANSVTDLEKEEEMWNLVGEEKTIQALAILNELKTFVPNYDYNIQALGWAETIIMKTLRKISTEEALKKVVNLIEITIPIEDIHNFVKNRQRGLMKNERVNRRVYFTSAEINCLILMSVYYNELKDYDNEYFYLKFLYEYFTDRGESNILYSETIYRTLIVKYLSMLGNMGEYALSNKLADISAKLQLQLYRPQKIWWHKYNNLWNDNIKIKDNDKYNAVLMECATFCQIYDGESMTKYFMDCIE